MAHRNPVRRLLGRHNSSDLRNGKYVSFTDLAFLDGTKRLRCHLDLTPRDSCPLRNLLFAHIHHTSSSLLVKMGQFHGSLSFSAVHYAIFSNQHVHKGIMLIHGHFRNQLHTKG
ncbi:hypothetical protein D3C79_982360 [compost metagenome]